LIPGINCKVSSFHSRYIWFRPNHWLSQKPYENLFKYGWVSRYILAFGLLSSILKFDFRDMANSSNFELLKNVDDRSLLGFCDTANSSNFKLVDRVFFGFIDTSNSSNFELFFKRRWSRSPSLASNFQGSLGDTLCTLFCKWQGLSMSSSLCSSGIVRFFNRRQNLSKRSSKYFKQISHQNMHFHGKICGFQGSILPSSRWSFAIHAVARRQNFVLFCCCFVFWRNFWNKINHEPRKKNGAVKNSSNWKKLQKATKMAILGAIFTHLPRKVAKKVKQSYQNRCFSFILALASL
jgi:hypothetical protein